MTTTLDVSSVGIPLAAQERTWDDRATMLYALGIGADELRYTTENSEGVRLVTVPTMAVTLRGRLLEVLATLGDIDPATALHAEEQVIIHEPLPVAGSVRTQTLVSAVYDKDPHALVVVETHAVDLDEREVFTTRSSVMVRGGGGFGGDRGPAGGAPLPEREPDLVVELATRADQALLYRLSGDRNPLHSDPVVARRAGFDRPILHGLCTLGFACRALVDTLCAGDPEALATIGARFSKPVHPGELLRIEIFTGADIGDDEGVAGFRVVGGGVGQEPRIVLDRGRATRRRD